MKQDVFCLREDFTIWKWNHNYFIEDNPSMKDDTAWFKIGDRFKELLVIEDQVVAVREDGGFALWKGDPYVWDNFNDEVDFFRKLLSAERRSRNHITVVPAPTIA